jgi:uncharacterized membrane protein
MKIYNEVNMKKNQSIEELIETRRVKNLNVIHNEHLTFGQAVSDRIAEVAGSWAFIITFIFLLIIWIMINTWVLISKPFDPFPFILLNLILSCIAALQAPIIMMSQNRQEAKDRLRSENDFLVDQKSEIIIEELYKKICAMEESINELSARLK